MSRHQQIAPVERLHYRGKYVISLEKRGASFLYSVSTKTGMPISAGVDMLSLDEQTAVEGIVSRLYGKGQEKAA